jgi:CBS domain-containing protein
MPTRLELRQVRHVMNADPAKVSPDTSVSDLVALFAQRDFEGFPVVDAEERLLGIVTKLDLLRAIRPAALRERPDLKAAAGLEVRDIMRPGVVTLEAEDPAVAAVDLMLETRFHSLPVVSRARGGPPRVVGMVSRGDLLRAFL